MALNGDTLYIADTENHLIRAVNLKTKTVSTLAGVGGQARQRIASGKLREIALNSPWAVQVVDGTLYVCMAGPHQIWSHKLGTETIGVYAGSGREDIIDGTLLESALAQPSGITTDGKFLYIADSEGSAIRRIGLAPKANVVTIAGASDLPLGRTLFEFGDKDGMGQEARFQHPLGVAYADKTLYVADAYNHKIRKIEFTAKGNKVTTLLGDGTAGDKLDPPRLSEPEGLSVSDGKLYIADTNNHRICVVDLKTGKLRVLKIAGLKPPKPSPTTDHVALVSGKNIQSLALQTVAAGKSVSVSVSVTLPENYKLNKDFPLRYRLTSATKQNVITAGQFQGRHSAKIDGKSIRFEIPLTQKPGKAEIEVALTLGYCRAGVGGLCRLNTTRWKIPLVVSAKGTQTSINLSAVIKPPQLKPELGKLKPPAPKSGE
jgi:sugar lactone lactonase YvrE